MTEDEVEAHIDDWLRGQGWVSRIAWGGARGIDIDAHRGTERWIIEAKGCESLVPMRVTYFIAMLGETLQRMDDPVARYSIALPDLAQFRGLWRRLPALARTHRHLCPLRRGRQQRGSLQLAEMVRGRDAAHGGRECRRSLQRPI
jgi:hypothetical protein